MIPATYSAPLDPGRDNDPGANRSRKHPPRKGAAQDEVRSGDGAAW